MRAVRAALSTLILTLAVLGLAASTTTRLAP